MHAYSDIRKQSVTTVEGTDAGPGAAALLLVRSAKNLRLRSFSLASSRSFSPTHLAETGQKR